MGDETLRVCRVVDGERGLVAQPGRLPAQQAGAHGVEGPDPHRPGDGADEGLDPVPHLTGRLVRERDGEDGEGRDAVLPDEMGNPPGEDCRLATPGPRDDEQGAGMVHGGLPLSGVEVAEQVGVVGGEGELFHTPIIHGRHGNTRFRRGWPFSANDVSHSASLFAKMPRPRVDGCRRRRR